MSTAAPDPSSELTPQQRRERIVAILARAVVRRVHPLRRSEASTVRDVKCGTIPPDAIVIARPEILV